jgi:predicted Zn finger-like uncharacterized protein
MSVKVECESCKAPYTIDERRIPAAGLRVRCPKCTKTFVVKKPGDGSLSDAAPVSETGASATVAGVPGVGGGLKLAAPPSAPAPAPAGLDDFGDIDLPAPAPEAALPAARPPALKKPILKGTALGLGGLVPGVVAAAAAKPEAELPAPRPAAPTQGGFGEIDLPALGRPAPPAAPSFEIDLPAPAQAGLPAPRGADLPAPRPKSTQLQFGEVDLPALGGIGLPAATAAGLPAVGGAGLPAAAPAGLPAPLTEKFGSDEFGAQLPALGAPLPALGAQLPALGARGPMDVAPPPADLFGGGGRDFSTAQTAVGPGYQPPSPAGDVSGFGSLELPRPSGPQDWGTPASGDLGFGAGTARGFDDFGFGDSLGTSPRAATGVGASAVAAPAVGPSLAPPVGPTLGGAGSDFGELELPGPGFGAMGASPAAQTFGSSQGGLGFDSFAPPPGPSGFPGPSGIDGGAVGSVDNRATGGVGFGEVDLGGGGGASEDPLEFGAIPEAAEGAADAGAFEAPLPKPKPEKAESAPQEEEAPKRPGTAGRIAVALLAVAIVGGASLQFNGDLGAFGWRAISDKLNADKHAAMLAAAVKRSREALGADSIARANEAVLAIEKDVLEAPRHGALGSYSAYVHFAWEVRFGKDAQRDSLARSALAKVPVDAPNRKLAEAARDVVAGQYTGARGLLRGILASEPKNVDAAVTLGELELRAKQPKDAIAAFEQAVKAKDDARTRGGLMRAYDAAGALEKAKAEATAVAAKFPAHASSRLLLARYGWESDRDEAAAMKWLTELEKPQVIAASAPSDLVDALTLRGNVHLARGRVTSAKKAFDDAVTAAKGSPVYGPRLGLGEVFLANGQFPQAITEFNLASQAAPELALPKVGVARALLKQENATQAKATLAPLKDPLLAGEIGYWLGQAEERLNPERPSEPIKIYEAAVKAQPSEVKPYVALANLQAKIGRMDEADATLAAAAKNVPPSEKLHLGIGELRFRQERYDQALAEFDKALELQPTNLEALFSKGKTLLRMGERAKLDAGKKVLDQVAAKDEKYPGLSLEYGLYYQKTDQIEEALKEYKKALERAPDDVDIQLSVARAQVEAGMREAEAKLRDILNRCGKSVAEDICTTEAKHYLGRALLNRGAVAESKTYLDAAAAKGDNNAQYHLYYGWALVELNSLPSAEVEISRALELDKSLGLGHWLRAEIDAKSGRYKEAIDAAKRALTIATSLAQAHATIAFSLKQLNQEDGALGEYAQAIKADPSNPRAGFWRFSYADIMFHRGAVGRALPELRDAVKQAKAMEPAPPWLPKAHFYLAEALRGSDKAEALKEYREYLTTSVGSTDPARKEAQAAVNELAGK